MMRIFAYLDLYNMGLDARKPVFGVGEQQRHRPAGALAQTDQRLCYLTFWNKSYLNLLHVKIQISS